MNKWPFQLVFLTLSLVLTMAHGEKADSQQDLHIRAESQTYDGNKKVTVHIGNVHVTKGTLVIDAARMEVVQDANGGNVGTLFSGPEKLVHYRQKREGGPDLWVEGEADKAVYDDTLGQIKLYNKAHLILLDGKNKTHESSGIYISYDSRTDFMSMNNTLDGVSVPGAGFTDVVIYPLVKKEADLKSPTSKSGDSSGNKPATKSSPNSTELH